MALARRASSFGCMLSLVVLGGCSESLFGAHRGGGDGGGGSDSGSEKVPDTCAEPCVADAAADFGGTTNGHPARWRYLEDHRDRTWIEMNQGPTELTGKAYPANRVTTCAAQPGAAACTQLPGALLVSSAGGASTADPAIEFTLPTDQVIQLSLHVFVPGGAADQTIRLYRNSREDALFTATATAGTPLPQTLTLAALAGDRFLVAVTPTSGGGTGAMNVGLTMFATAKPGTFPAECQLAVPFETSSSGVTQDRCQNFSFQQLVYSPPNGVPSPTMNLVTAVPFPEQGHAVELPGQSFIMGELPATHPLDWSKGMTVQFWVQFLMIPGGLDQAVIFSDLDPDIGGGVGIYVIADFQGGPGLSVIAATHGSPLTFDHVTVAYPGDGSWQFVRVVRAGGAVNLCMNGTWVTSLPVRPNESFMTGNPPYFGKDTETNVAAFFNGRIDDVRAITGALPCAP